MINIGVIGFGRMGQFMAGLFNQIEGVSVAGVAEIAAANIRAAEAHGLPVYTDYRALLDQPLAGVYVATPNARHKENVPASTAPSRPWPGTLWPWCGARSSPEWACQRGDTP